METTVLYSYTPTHMTKIKPTDNTKCQEECIILEQVLAETNIHSLQSQNYSTSRYTMKKNENKIM